jgi:formylglycine-generating enzyme required for sulfatase activity
MSGNSWDWTSTLFQPYPYDAGDGRESEVSGEAGRRVVRGGSWDVSLILARAACRLDLLPGGRYDGVGFRVLFPAPIFSVH